MIKVLSCMEEAAEFRKNPTPLRAVIFAMAIVESLPSSPLNDTFLSTLRDAAELLESIQTIH